MKNLKEARLQMGLSQQKLADMIGFSQQTIYQYENGITQPDLTTLKKLADCLHTTTDYLTGYSDLPVDSRAPDSGFTSEDVRLLRAIQRLPEESRRAIQVLIDELNRKQHP